MQAAAAGAPFPQHTVQVVPLAGKRSGASAPSRQPRSHPVPIHPAGRPAAAPSPLGTQLLLPASGVTPPRQLGGRRVEEIADLLQRRRAAVLSGRQAQQQRAAGGGVQEAGSSSADHPQRFARSRQRPGPKVSAQPPLPTPSPRSLPLSAPQPQQQGQQQRQQQRQQRRQHRNIVPWILQSVHSSVTGVAMLGKAGK